MNFLLMLKREREYNIYYTIKMKVLKKECFK